MEERREIIRWKKKKIKNLFFNLAGQLLEDERSKLKFRIKIQPEFFWFRL